MLEQAMKQIETTLLSRRAFHPFPKYGEAGWDALPEEAKRVIVGRAELLAGKDWPALPAVRYMDFVKNGDRSRFEAVYFERRIRLRCLTVAECIERQGRFLDSIIDGVWAICEETTWAMPAHSAAYKRDDQGLVDITRDRVTLDLFAAETGANLAWILYLIGDELNRACEAIPRRVEYEIARRVTGPFLEYDDYWWMGLASERPVNNWNPWINENVLSCALVAVGDEARRVGIVKKVCRSAQRFLDFYAPDGGCDEGPSYFTVAGASLIDILEQLYLATEGQVDLFGEPLIQNMADYIRRAHIADDWFVNFADSPARLTGVAEEALLRLANRTDNKALRDFCVMRLARHRGRRPDRFITHSYQCMFRALAALFDWDEAAYQGAARDVASPGSWFGGIQVAAARQREDSFSGLFLAAKGGCNAESHNHNDIGNYIIYADGRPAVVDAGVGVYTKKTFSERRYEIWTMQSGWHNTAVINGCDQLSGREYAASDVTYSDDGAVMRLTLDMGGAYGPEAGVETYRRAFTFDRGQGRVAVRDEVKLSACRRPVALPLLCAAEPVIGRGEARIGALRLRFDPARFSARAEEKPLEDARLEAGWGRKSLWRLTLTRAGCAETDDWTLEYDMGERESRC
ncbi:MAG: heparinase II/III family protein [Clostridia bacterium]|nr:heparinase II/III family protein [Clostridia bacterium]